MALNIGQLIATIGTNITPLKTGLTAAEQAMQSSSTRMAASMAKVGGVMKTVGRNMSKFITLPLLAVGAAAFKLSMDFEESMSKIEGLVGVARDQVDDWGKDILKMAPELGKGPRELADALFFVTSAGIKGAEAMEVLEMSAKASAAGLGETKTVADLVTSAMNAYGKENLNAAMATDILVATVREGKAEASELAAAMGMVLPIASEMGVSFDQVGAAMAAMTRTGTNAAVASTQLKAILASMLAPADNAKKAMIDMGLGADQMRKMIREDGLIAALEHLRKTTNQYGEEAIADVIPNIRALMGVLDLMGKNAGDNKIIFDNLTKATGSLGVAIGAASDTAKFKLNQTLAASKAALTSLGKSVQIIVLPVLAKLAKMMTKLSTWLSKLTDGQRKWVAGLGLVAAAMGPVLMIFGHLLTVLPKIGMAFKALSVAMIANPITAILVGLTAALAIIIPKLLKWRKSLKFAKNATIEMAKANDTLRESFGTLGGALEELDTRFSQLNLSQVNQQLADAEKAIVSLKEQYAEAPPFGISEAAHQDALIKDIKLIEESIIALEKRRKAIMDEGFETEKGTAIIHALNEELTALEESLEKATTETEIGRINDKITELNDTLERLQNLSARGISTGGIMEKLATGAEKAKEGTVQVTTALENIPPTLDKIGFAVSTFSIDTQKRLSELGQELNWVTEQFVSNAIAGVAAGVGNLISGQGSIADIFKGVLQMFGGFLQAYGKALVEYGVALKVTQLAIANPIAAIIAGGFAIATGVIISNLSKAGPFGGDTRQMKDGGLLFGPTNVRAGEYQGARSNPEMFGALDKVIPIIQKAVGMTMAEHAFERGLQPALASPRMSFTSEIPQAVERLQSIVESNKNARGGKLSVEFEARKMRIWLDEEDEFNENMG